ncbi:MAG TPA: cytochrome b [Pseudomonadales bacterium]|nr:cytochrome b [Pseudomonadales bacterium]HNI37288.1 cytochrome b [Pseudomonadales bacterium]
MNHSRHYHSLSITLHWLTLFLLIAVYALMECKGIYPKGSEPRDVMKMWHFMLGLSVLGVTVIRLVARWKFSAPVITPTPSAWQQKLAKWMHIALYIFLVAMPILGWMTLSAAGKPIPFFGLQLPALLAVNQALAHDIKEIHETIAVLGYFLIGVHAGAAVFHHHFMRDDTLIRILPSFCRQKIQR